MKNAKKDRKPDIALDAPPGEQSISHEEREKLVAKAKFTRQAVLSGYITQEEADAIVAAARAACLPSEESLAKAKAAKEELKQAERLLKLASNPLIADMVDPDKLVQAQAKVEAASIIYAEAAKAAKGFSMGGGGGGPRYKGQMSGLDAAYAILSESVIPMNAAAITKAAMERGLWNPDGLTPAATLSGALQTDVKKGENARFVKVGAGLYAVRK